MKRSDRDYLDEAVFELTSGSARHDLQDQLAKLYQGELAPDGFRWWFTARVQSIVERSRVLDRVTTNRVPSPGHSFSRL